MDKVRLHLAGFLPFVSVVLLVLFDIRYVQQLVSLKDNKIANKNKFRAILDCTLFSSSTAFWSSVVTFPPRKNILS
jgi:hypothetical protein